MNLNLHAAAPAASAPSLTVSDGPSGWADPRAAAAGPPPVILELRDLVKAYPGGQRALAGVSLTVARSEVVAIIGPSGCGKSTLLRTVNGLEPIQSGTISLDGEPVSLPGAKWHQVRQRVGMVFQSYNLFPHRTVLGNLLLAPLMVAKADKQEAKARAGQLLERVGLADRADAYPRHLSGGQKQRVAIVRALMMRPELLLLDEITAALDPEMVREVLDVVLELARDGMTMLIVTHEMDFARAIADRVVFMDAGEVIEISDTEHFFANPASARARQFLNTLAFDADPGTATAACPVAAPAVTAAVPQLPLTNNH